MLGNSERQHMFYPGGGPPPDLTGGGAPSDRLGGRGAPTDQAFGAPPHGMNRDNGGPLSFGVQSTGLLAHAGSCAPTRFSFSSCVCAQDDTDTRYFIIRSSTDFNVDVSMQRGVWATIPRNETRLAQAVQEARSVVLFFRVQSSPSWSGYALMKNAPGQGSCPSSVFAGRSGRPFVGRTFDVEWIRKIPLNVEKTRHLVNRFNNGESVNRAMDGQLVDPEAGRALVYLFEEAYMAAGGCPPPHFNPVYGGPVGPLLPQHGQVVHHPQAPLQMQSQRGRARQCAWQPQLVRVQDSAEPQLVQRQQSGGSERKKQVGRRQERSNATANGAAADGSLPMRAPSNPAMRVFPIVLTDMNYDAYISAYEDSQALWQRVFKKHGFDVGDDERREEISEGEVPLQLGASTEEQFADTSALSKTTEGKNEGTTTQEEGLSVTSSGDDEEKLKEPVNLVCGETEEVSSLPIKVEKEE
ncbi:hypothetical protein Esti_005229 [Eimeria stiedai]